jgi:hypothetical protein
MEIQLEKNMDKFTITRTDGKPIEEGARFFVLRLDKKTRPDNNACRAAVVTYIREAHNLDPEAAMAAQKVLHETS